MSLAYYLYDPWPTAAVLSVAVILGLLIRRHGMKHNRPMRRAYFRLLFATVALIVCLPLLTALFECFVQGVCI